MNRRFNRRPLPLARGLVVLCWLVASAFPASAAELAGVVNVNTATIEQLELLPGIGESRAKAIVSLRKSKGGFKSVEELGEVKGIGDRALTKMRPFVALQGKTTLEIR